MLTISESAKQELENFFADRERQTIRIYLAGGGCCGPRLALAIDEPGSSDTTLEASGFSFCVDQELLAQVKGVSIDLNYMGFLIDTEEPLPGAGSGGGCAGCGGGCGGGED